MHKELSVGIIMDGNRRWAKEKGTSVAEGHRAGVHENLFALVKDYASLKNELGVKYLTFYAFSTENWNRKKDEVSNLMVLFGEILKSIEQELKEMEEAPRIIFIGNAARFEVRLQEGMRHIEEKTRNNDGVIAVALSYGGRDEIVRAAQCAEELSEEGIAAALDTAGIPDPDLIIRTGGEKRLSNFLLWQAAYSELFFIDTYWPDFTKETLKECIKEYNERERRHGV